MSNNSKILLNQGIITENLIKKIKKQQSLKEENYLKIDNNKLIKEEINQNIILNTKSIRKCYEQKIQEPFLVESNMKKCPFNQFDVWFKNICEIEDLTFNEVNAFALSTVSSNYKPSCRMLLLKGYSTDGFVFFTHSISKKGCELLLNQNASMLFYWPRVDRQIRIEGIVSILDDKIADDYWLQRPIDSRIGSKLSEQSSTIPNREYLEEKQIKLEILLKQKGECSITRPSTWLGYILKPNYFEFWQGQSNRVHDRIIYELNNEENKWKMTRLAP
ncbi:hypothetical protein Mgra_00000632 [Meloidogyne graminicola]|uniref:pyridoxal 5'-phosphate synthase n=1 Tax=Meloidogyne graminicola TaxID=189291 RepID=A0A8T0A0Z1_9BILA|nr:hypothetical protein Mgra_00000632 [Meloidogyne graminicola]